MTRGWPATLREGRVALRPDRPRRPRRLDQRARASTATGSAPWEATPPVDVGPPMSFAADGAQPAQPGPAGTLLPFVVTYDGALVGQLTVGGITWGSLCSAHVGYWIDARVAGRGVMPTAVALAVDHCFQVLRLHRVEVNIRPENTASLRVVEKLGFRDEGLRRGYLHIDGRGGTTGPSR